jgi:hypothetical protein
MQLLVIFFEIKIQNLIFLLVEIFKLLLFLINKKIINEYLIK